MKSIGFKNFRRFIEFPELIFNDITLMVGINNSGKSTLVKAVLLVVDYLKNQQNKQFSFSTKNIKDVNILSFDRARCKGQPDFIIFNCVIAPCFDVKIKISGDKASIIGKVEEIEIRDNDKHLSFIFSYSTASVKVTKERPIVELMDLNLEKMIESIEKKIVKKNAEAERLMKEGKDFLSVINDIDILNKEYKLLNDKQNFGKYKKELNVYSISYDLNMDRSPSSGNFEDYIKEFLNENENEKRRLINLRDKDEFSEEDNEKLEEINLVFESQSELNESISTLVKSIYSHYYYYWSAEIQKQSALFSIRDENNALAMAIHDFCKMQIMRGDEEWLFVVNQMRVFDIGYEFKLLSHAGEAYECDVIEKGNFAVSLADKGMGTIQLMTLLFRLATIIRQQKLHKENITLVIEEPELNLHPKLQSQLILLFHSMNKQYSIKFIIETHSEYLVRRSQVLVAEQNYKDNKDLLDGNMFVVYYFPIDEKPYSMNYLPSGRFENKFNKGFFDEAGKWHMEIVKKERGL